MIQIIEKFKGNEKRSISERPPETKDAEISNTRMKYEKIKQAIKNSRLQSTLIKDLQVIESQLKENPYIDINTGTQNMELNDR